MAVIFKAEALKSHALGWGVSPRNLRRCLILLPAPTASNTQAKCRPRLSSVETLGKEQELMKKKTKLTIETERVFFIRRGIAECDGVCRACVERVNFITADEAATLGRVSARTIYRLVGKIHLHLTETTLGSLLICVNSLRGGLTQAQAEPKDNSDFGTKNAVSQ